MPVGASTSISTIAGQRSFDELGTALCDVTFCVIDLETTGGDRNGDTITEVGAVKVLGGECLGTYQTLVNPGRAIPPQITMLTGLTDALVANAPRIESVLPSLLEFIGDSVIVGHNVSFDVGFLRAALRRTERPTLANTAIDTVALARRLVRDEVPNCKLATLASRLRLDHQPSHRALDDALATTDLLHVLVERAAGWGVLGLDDLLALSKLGGHPQAAKLALTADLPRSPGVYMFRGAGDEVLYVGKASNLRHRVRSYFGSDDRRKIGPMLREAQSVHHIELPDALSAEVVERRMIAKLLPRYNRAGTRADKYCYVRLDTTNPWPRLAIVKNPSRSGLHLGPLPSRTSARLVVEAVQSVIPLRRCSARLGRNHRPEPGARECTAAQLGVAMCPCAGTASPVEYAQAVEAAARTLRGDTTTVEAALRARMMQLAAEQRFEEAALARDRLDALLTALKRHRQVEALRAAGQVDVHRGDVVWHIDGARLLDVTVRGTVGRALPIEAHDAPPTDQPLPRTLIDEALCLARFIERHHATLQVKCDGEWRFPLDHPQLLAA
ncbi:MAG: DEDD exonuclease domain-containing protein [Actinomycetota bacterium]